MKPHLIVNAVFASLLFIAAANHFMEDQSTPSNDRALAANGKLAGPSAGNFPDDWISGTDCDNDPEFQVHPYNEDLYIIRQSKCEIFEGPFLYLIFGDEKALLMDTGALANAPVAETVFGAVDDWLARNNRADIPLIVAHTHSHGDHIQGDGQFIGDPRVETVVPLGVPQVASFWGFKDYPNDIPTFDLGNRIIDVIGTPGHQPASVTLYDRRTELLLTGDIVYPGHLFIFAPGQWPIFVESIQRLVDFAAANPIQWVLGCHIEMTAGRGRSYRYGTIFQAREHTLEFEPSILQDILDAAQSMGNSPSCEIFDEFVIHPVYLCGITWNG